MAGDNRLAGVATHDDLAGPDADTELESRPPVVLELGSQLGKSLTNLDRSPHGTQRIVLVDRRNTKNGGQPSPHRLLDGRAVPREHREYLVEASRRQLVQRFGVELDGRMAPHRTTAPSPSSVLAEPEPAWAKRWMQSLSG